MTDHNSITVEKWGMFEQRFQGPSKGNPFVDVKFDVQFTFDGEDFVKVSGFYDGNGEYVVRFMPEKLGVWRYQTISNAEELNNICGLFTCVENSQDNHGPVKVYKQYHFAYADGKIYYPFGTTCYAWIHQSQNLQELTLKTLSESCYNKLRMCVFPKYYHNNSTEPELYPFEGTAPNHWDYSKFNPAFFKHLEQQIVELQKLGIEADLILFHPYDEGHWGFDRMDNETDERYLRYIVARLSAYRNIWWSMANEYDYMREKTKENWDRNIEIVAESDPYHHLLSIHQGDILYDHWNPHISHASIQLGTKDDIVSTGFGVYKTHRDVYHKPVIYDEVGYEGNLPQRWGSLTAQELVDKFWKATVSGAYMTHGETFTHPEDIIWWAKGGELKGQSTSRIEFLKYIVQESGVDGLEPLDRWWVLNGAGHKGKYYLFYFGTETPVKWEFKLPAFKTTEPLEYGTKFRVDIIDTWNMTIQTVPDIYEVTDQNRYFYSCNHHPVVELPGRKYMAIRVTRL